MRQTHTKTCGNPNKTSPLEHNRSQRNTKEKEIRDSTRERWICKSELLEREENREEMEAKDVTASPTSQRI